MSNATHAVRSKAQASYRPNPAVVARIVQLYERGASGRTIARETGERLVVVRRIVAEWKAVA